jgi:hypothetical protein
MDVCGKKSGPAEESWRTFQFTIFDPLIDDAPLKAFIFPIVPATIERKENLGHFHALRQTDRHSRFSCLGKEMVKKMAC